MNATGSAAMRPMRGLPSPLLALEFLTVLRVRRPPLATATEVARAQLWYPLVGLGIGLIVAGLDVLLRPRLPALPEAAILVALLSGLTGFLHLDGLADCADGLLGLHVPEKRLDIMRDSRIGTFGAVAIALDLLLLWSPLATLSGPARAAAITLAPALGRAAIIVVALFPQARPGGLASGFREAARGPYGIGALLLAALIAAGVLGAGGLALGGVALAVGLAVAVAAWLRLRGVTGDVFGAACELAQASVLLCACAWQGWLRPWL